MSTRPRPVTPASEQKQRGLSATVLAARVQGPKGRPGRPWCCPPAGDMEPTARPSLQAPCPWLWNMVLVRR